MGICCIDNLECNGEEKNCHLGKEEVIDCFVGDEDENIHIIEYKEVEGKDKRNKNCLYYLMGEK